MARTRLSSPLTSLSEVRAAASRSLEERGLSLKDGEYTPYTAAELKRTFPRLTEYPAAGILIGYHDVKGEATGFFRYRYLEQPPLKGFAKLTDRKKDKYRYVQHAGERPRAYFPQNFAFQKYFSLPAQRRAPLLITEGEFKADAAAKNGLPSIGLGGVNNFRYEGCPLLPDLSRLPWKGMRVEICFDSDAASNQSVLDAQDGLARQLELLGAEVYTISLPQVERVGKTGLDDLLASRGGLERFRRLGRLRWYPPEVPRLKALSREEFLAAKYPEREVILASPAAELMRHPSITQIHAYRGVGKTNLAFYLAGALAEKEREFLRWKSQCSLRVLYVEGEQIAADLQEQVRLQTMPSPNLFVMSREDQEDSCFPSITTAEGRKAFERYLTDNKIQLVVFDSLSTLANVAMNEEENQLALGDWLVRLRTGLRISVVYLHHDGKAGQQRGHSKHEDWIDLSLHLTWVGGYQGAEGLRCHFHIDKARRPIADGQDMRLEFGPTPRDPRFAWSYKTATQAEEKEDAVFTAACLALWEDPELSDRALIANLKEKGLKGKNQMFRETCKRARAHIREKQGLQRPPKIAGGPGREREGARQPLNKTNEETKK